MTHTHRQSNIQAKGIESRTTFSALDRGAEAASHVSAVSYHLIYVFHFGRNRRLHCLDSVFLSAGLHEARLGGPLVPL